MLNRFTKTKRKIRSTFDVNAQKIKKKTTSVKLKKISRLMKSCSSHVFHAQNCSEFAFDNSSVYNAAKKEV